MGAQGLPTDYEKLLDYLIEKVTPQDIIDFSLSESVQARAEYLFEGNRDAQLTPEEAKELTYMVELDLWFAVHKAKALQKLKQQ